MGRLIKPKNKSKGLIVVTGCDTGIGRSLAKILVKKGYQVALSYLNENPFANKPGFYAKKMDLRVPSEVHEFCLFVKELCQSGMHLDALVNNAGVALGGPVENIPLTLYREAFEINYFGVVTVTKELIPELIKNKGKIMVIGSLAGKIAMPFMSPYVSTKFALEGFCDSLRREMNPFGVKTILIEPGGVATEIWNTAMKQDISFVEEKYRDSLHSFQTNFIENGNKGMDQDAASNMIANILLKNNPKARYLVAQNRLTTKILTLIPNVIFDKVVVKLFQMHYQ